MKIATTVESIPVRDKGGTLEAKCPKRDRWQRVRECVDCVIGARLRKGEKIILLVESLHVLEAVEGKITGVRCAYRYNIEQAKEAAEKEKTG